MTFSFIDQLYATVTPLSEHKPMMGKREKKPRARSSTPDANAQKQLEALLAYHAVWEPDEEWLHTAKVDSRRGGTRTGSLPSLRAWEKRGWVTCRPVNPKKPRIYGYEWRWNLNLMPADIRLELLRAAHERNPEEVPDPDLT